VPRLARTTKQDSVRELQRTLYRAAKADPGRRFHALYDKVHRRDVLERAWKLVRANRGAAGIDKQTIADVERYGVSRLLDELAADLKDGRWRPLPARRVFIPKPGKQELRPLSIPAVRDRVVQAATKIVIEPIFGVSWRSCGRLAGESPAGVMAKQPRSWWPAEGETRPSKRHDEAPLGGEQPTGPYDEESCRLVRLSCVAGQVREPSPAKMGEGDRRREELGSAAPMDPPGYGDRNGWIAGHGTGEIRLGTGVMWPRAAVPRCPVTAKPISSDPAKRWSAERKSAGAICSVDGRDNTTRPERRAPSQVCVQTEEGPRDCLTGCTPAHRAVARPMPQRGRLDHRPTRVAPRNARNRLPGGAPDEGEPHVRCGKGALETERRSRRPAMATGDARPWETAGMSAGPTAEWRHRASALLHRPTFCRARSGFARRARHTMRSRC
jgi:hypothetical protein